jgi:acetolactate synthase-1/2/3 large subunit
VTAAAMTGADLIAGRLAALGVGSVFSVAGASHAFLLRALHERGIAIISSRHESGAVSAADGYARISRGLGVALIVGEQGLPNAIGGLAAAYAANSPVLLLMALPPENLVEARSISDQHKLELVAPLSKYARIVPGAARLADYLHTACHQALSGRPGPVVLGLPGDVVTAPCVDDLPARREHEPARPAADPALVARAAEWLGAARRPLIIAGAGACWGNAGEGLARLRDLGIPVTANGLGRGLVPEDWASSFSWPFAQLAAAQADCVLLVGARLTQRLGFGLPPRFHPQARFIQIDICAEEAHRNRPIDLFIHANAGQATAAIASALARAAPPATGRVGWLKGALAPRFAAVARLRDDTGPPASGAAHPLQLGRELAALMPADTIYIGDGADIQNWMYGAIAVRQAPGFLDHYPLGAMGIGTALAVGAATAARDLAASTGKAPRHTVLVTGDGSFGFHPAELHAAALAGLKLVVVIGNDGAWGTEVHEQRRAIGTDINTRLGALAYEQVAAGFGCRGIRVEHLGELRPALEAAFAADGPVVVNVLTDPEAGAAIKQDDNLRMIMFSDLQTGQTLRAAG